ncbi:MAG TPA: DivIVA domain-containing protein [Galbitalea sp.]|jgi:DivIVA domain-containing protein|nr:DivIVA domain-containing protein [Galbitalea sp.]
MALTPEDVVNKRFQPTKFREGYDQDEVDDFLDEVVVELRRLNQENEELRQRVITADSRANELQRTAGQPQQAGFDPQAPAPAPAPFQPAPVAATDPTLDAGNTNNLLQLARRLHEEHVREGVEKRDALIADGQAQAARAVEDGHAQAARVVEEAQSQTRNAMSSLDQERVALEQRIDELRNFEREYRTKLKGYIEGQLRELDSSSAVLTGAGAPAAVAGQGYAGQIAPAPANYPGFAGN